MCPDDSLADTPRGCHVRTHAACAGAACARDMHYTGAAGAD